MWYRPLISNTNTSRTKRCKSQARNSDILLELEKYSCAREFKINKSFGLTKCPRNIKYYS